MRQEFNTPSKAMKVKPQNNKDFHNKITTKFGGFENSYYLCT